MSHYLDTSIIFSMIAEDAHSVDAAAWFSKNKPGAIVSSLAAAEFSAVTSRHVRVGLFTSAQGKRTLGIFDEWVRRSALLVAISNEDIDQANRLIRDFESGLLAPDAIHLAAARRIGVILATFDARLAEAAKRHAVPVVIPG